MNNPISTLDALRPRLDESPVYRDDGAAQLAELLTRADAPLPALTVRRPFAGNWGLAVTAAGFAVLLLLLPVLGQRDRPGLSSAQAASLHQLATRAGSEPTDHIGPGQYRYFKIEQTGTTETVEGIVQGRPSYLEEWVASDGTLWRRDTGPTGQVERYRFAPDNGTGNGSYSPEYLAGLPTEPHALYKHLRAHASGSSSTDEAVFVAVGDMLRTQVASPRLRAAAINALAYLPIDVQPATPSASGVQGVLVSMDRPRQQGTEAMLINDDTSAVIEERYTYRYDGPIDAFSARALTGISTVVVARVAEGLPTDMQGVH